MSKVLAGVEQVSGRAIQEAGAGHGVETTLTEVCRCCGQPVPEGDGIAAEVQRLRSWCVENARWVSPDGRVHADTAAEILGASMGTMRNWRQAGTGPNFHRRGSRGPVTYSLQALAEYIESQRHRCT